MGQRWTSFSTTALPNTTIGTLNDTRAALGFKRYTSFDQITSDKQVAADLKTAYGTVDQVELWIGGLAEDHAKGAFVEPIGYGGPPERGLAQLKALLKG